MVRGAVRCCCMVWMVLGCVGWSRIMVRVGAGWGKGGGVKLYVPQRRQALDGGRQSAVRSTMAADGDVHQAVPPVEPMISERKRRANN